MNVLKLKIYSIMRAAKWDVEPMDMYTKLGEKMGKDHFVFYIFILMALFFFFYSRNISFFPCRSDTKDYALKQIEGTGLSMSACREIAVSKFNVNTIFTYLYWLFLYFFFTLP